MRRWCQRGAAALLVAVVLAVGGAALAWRVSGGRWLSMTTPSMGRAAPVGTLLLTRPVSASSVRVGQLVAFHPPGRPGTTYTHRVVSVDAGAIRTKGDVNGSVDAWTLHQANLVGVVVARWWTLGWWLQAGPLLVVGAAVVVLATAVLRAGLRLPARLVLLSLVACFALWRYHPLVRAEAIDTVSQRGGAEATMVSTGLLPVRLHAAHGTAIHLIDGQVGRVTAKNDGTRYRFLVSPDLSLWWWVALIGIGLTPLALGLIIGVPEERELVVAT